MSKSKKTPDTSAKSPAKATAPVVAAPSHAMRETVESIVIAFVLAFLFRTFEAEAFVIPTGSMAPTLMGRHKDVVCPKCGYRYQVSASEEESEEPGRQTSDCLAGMCPMCHYVLPMRPNLPKGLSEEDPANISLQRSYNGDRILVNKYIYAFSDPKRWDVVVFKFPGDAKINYIKRLVGLPGERLRIYHGDIFIAAPGAAPDGDFKIERKPPKKILAMRQLVHDTNYDPADLYAAGWPLRWHSPATNGAKAWDVDTRIDGKDVHQRYSIDAARDADSWLRYQHIVPTYQDWQRVTESQRHPSDDMSTTINGFKDARPQLITDANPYDAREDRIHLYNPGRTVVSRDSLEIDRFRQGVNWVGDLMMEADVEAESANGDLLLDLVEGGRHFTCRCNLATGEALLSIAGIVDFAPKATTALQGTGKHHVAFANFDDQLLLWVDKRLVKFEGGTAYDVDKTFGNRERIRPQTSEKDLGDLAPAGIGARGAKIAVNHLQVWRDIYYIADSSERNHGGEVTDFDHLESWMFDLPKDPLLWDRYSKRQKAEFSLNSEQLFVMGDNSVESSDARLWLNGTRGGGKPGGHYLERRLLIGKALCVYWPHSWNRIPGTPIPFPLSPNIADIRLVR